MKLDKRIEIYERDRYTCQYCARTGNIDNLSIERINLNLSGDKDDKKNLITSCRRCNMYEAKNNVSRKSAQIENWVNDFIISNKKPTK